jgi:chromate transporter
MRPTGSLAEPTLGEIAREWGRIIGSAIPLAAALSETWQYAVLAAAAVALLALRRSIVVTLLAAGTIGAVAGLLGAPIPH